MVLGNHGTYETAEYLKYFSKVHGVVQFKEGLMTHVPVACSQLDRFKFNIHGHLHTNRVQKYIEPNHEDSLDFGGWVNDTRYINVSCEQINLTPISWEELCLPRP